MTDRLTELGWRPVFADAFAPYADRCLPARVALEHQHIYRVYTAEGETLTRVRGRLRHQAERRDAFPAVGDWVALSPGSATEEAAIDAVLPRLSRFSRKSAGELTEEQFRESGAGVELVKTSVHRAGEIAELDPDAKAIHRVCNRSRAPLATLHLYGVAAERLTTGINRMYAMGNL